MLFEDSFRLYLPHFKNVLEAEDGSWNIKGFVDSEQRVYSITNDTKVISKIVEIVIFPLLNKFANENDYQFFPAQHQNHYPDVTFVQNQTGEKIALDIKTSYRKNKTTINGMTLGAFTGYFRDRASTKNILYPYAEYDTHYVLGIIYSRTEHDNSFHVYDISDLDTIDSVVEDFAVFFQEKWKIATDMPGSGNTKNIGGITDIDRLQKGEGPFSLLDEGKKIFDDYWMNYETRDMAQRNNTTRYRNLGEYMVQRRNDLEDH